MAGRWWGWSGETLTGRDGYPSAPLKNRSLRLLLSLAALAVVVFLFSPRFTREMRDFEVYWTAASRAVHAEPLYRAEDGHFQFKYLPAFAIAAAPLAALPLPAAKALWFATSVVLLITLIALSLRLLPERRRPTWFLVVVIVVTLGKFFGHELTLGQVNLLFAVLSLSGILAVRHQRERLAAPLFVGAAVVKPYAVLFLPWLAATRRKAATMASALVLLVLAAPVVVYGFAGTIVLYRDWWATVTSSTAPNLTNPDNVSVAALTAKWFGEPGKRWATVIVVTLLAVAGAVTAAGRRLPSRETLEGALLLTMIPLISPQGWDYVFVVATPAVAIIANYEDRLPALLRALTWVALATIGLSIYDLLGRELYARFMALSVITICFFVVIAALTALRIRNVI